MVKITEVVCAITGAEREPLSKIFPGNNLGKNVQKGLLTFIDQGGGEGALSSRICEKRKKRKGR